MAEDHFFDRLIELRDDMRTTLEHSEGADECRDAGTRARLHELERLIAEWVDPRR